MKKILYFILLQLSCMGMAQVGIGTTSPNTKSMLDIVSTEKGVLMPRMSQAQRDAISPGTIDAGRDGLLIYNTDTGCYNYWNIAQSAWVSLCQTACDPSTFADFTIDCNQFPAADTNTYTAGGAVTGNTITVSVNVTHVGPYSIGIISDNGVSYSATGTFSATGTQNVTVANAAGAPSSSTLNFSVKSNGISACTYTKSSVAAASYTYSCSSATVTPSMTEGVQGSGIVKVPVAVTGTGNIPAINQTINGVVYTFAGITGATSSTTSIDIAYSGTPSTADTDLPMTNSDGSVCSIHISHSGVTPAIFSTSSITPHGTYTVATDLTSSNKINVVINVSEPGKLRLKSTDKNGIFFDSGEVVTTTTGSQTIVMNAATATTGKFPMTSEEVSQGGNGSNNQSSSYSVSNAYAASGGSSVSGSFSIDVKPHVWETFISGNIKSLRTGADNGMFRLEVEDGYTLHGNSGTPEFYKVWAHNLSGSSMTASIFVRSSADNLNQIKKWSGTISSGEKLGSLDCYLQNDFQGTNVKPITTGDVGAHAGIDSAIYGEVSGTGATFTMANTSGSKWFNNLGGTKKFKYRIIFNTREYWQAKSGTNTAIVLYGIYDSSTSVTNVDPGFGGDIPMGPAGVNGVGGNPREDYWP
ncbi:hypothetical protein ACP3T3_00780 [Chryseobacterium sp. CBSDS_008]|uniref:hypothetical protein n=1 Tax=Chryseobacterium sp. CBSDS_008 TaxID=3415265 RepID=UPI003CE6BA74